jgi:hypothetical protein
MKKFLILKLVSLMLIGTCHAIQRPKETSEVSSRVSQGSSGNVETVRASLQQNARRQECSASQEVASGESRSLQSTFTSVRTTQKGTAVTRAIAITKESMCFVRASVHGGKTARQRSLSSKRRSEGFASQQMQLCNWLVGRLPDSMLASRTVSTKVETFACAIARTEGYFQKGSIPNRLNNPGDLTSQIGNAYPGQQGLYKQYVVFRTAQDGWKALRSQIQRVIDGTSTKYTQEMTMLQIARVYAASPQWLKTLGKILRISPKLTFEEYFGLAPRVKFTPGRFDEMLIQRMFQTFPLLEPVQDTRHNDGEGRS